MLRVHAHAAGFDVVIRSRRGAGWRCGHGVSLDAAPPGVCENNWHMELGE